MCLTALTFMHAQSAILGLLKDSHAASMTFNVTPHGIQAHVPIITCGEKTYAYLFWSREDAEDALVHHDVPETHFLLCLEKDPVDYARPSSCSASYIVSNERILYNWPRRTFTSNACSDDRETTLHARWETVLIRHRPPLNRLPGQLADTRTPFIPPIPIQSSLIAPVRFDEARIRSFMGQFRSCSRVKVLNSAIDQASDLPTTYAFFCDLVPLEWFTVIVRAGRCCREVPSEPGPQLEDDYPSIWATISGIAWGLGDPNMSESEMEAKVVSLSTDSSHCCREDHVSQWPMYQKTFYMTIRHRLHWALSPTVRWHAVTLSFSPCPINPGGTLILRASYDGESFMYVAHALL